MCLGVKIILIQIVLFERHCHVIEKSEAIACARSSQLTRRWTEKNNRKKWRTKEVVRHKGSLTPPPSKIIIILIRTSYL
jgi:hypothetical protein